MRFFEILVEGEADVPAVKGILERRFGLMENRHFRIHAHQGKGKLPENALAKPNPKHRGLLDQLPAKLRGYAHLPEEYVVVVLVDADRTPCKGLKEDLLKLLHELPNRPRNVLFRIAVEETESWLIADPVAIKRAYPRARVTKLPGPPHDQVIGAWEKLAEVLGYRPKDCDRGHKVEWASQITPHLNLETPQSPSLRNFIGGLSRYMENPAP